MNENRLKTRLCNFEIYGLYGEFNHKIPLNTHTHVTAIIAPNGMGKTLCLKCIQALFKLDWHFYRSIDFQKILFEFTDETTIEINKINDASTHDHINHQALISIVFSIKGDSKKTLEDKDLGDSYSWIQKIAPYMERKKDNVWVDTRDGELLSERELVLRFDKRASGRLLSKTRPGMPRQTLDQKNKKKTKYTILRKYIDLFNCKLIETQRLIILNDNSSQRFHFE